MPTSDYVKRIFRAFRSRDDAAFMEAAQRLIEEERLKGHALLAGELERILLNGNSRLNTPNPVSHDIPMDKERGLPLVQIERHDLGWEYVILSVTLKELLDNIVAEFRKREVLRTYGARFKGKILFFGPPGCGKTFTARVLAGVLDLPLLYVRFDSVVSSYLGETAANLRKVFDFAERGHWVVLFDEFDAIGKERNSELEHGELKRVVNSLLQMMDNFQGDSLLIAATNHQMLLDPALWRRFDEICYFDYPSAGERKRMAQRFLAGIKHDAKVVARLARAMNGASGGDIERVSLDAVKHSILDGRDALKAGDVDVALKRHRYRSEATCLGKTGRKPSSRKRRNG